MQSFTKEEVAKFADIAHIAVTEAELEEFAVTLTELSEAIGKISAVVGDDVPATIHPIPIANVLRDDVVGESLDLDEVFAMAPHHEDGKFAVPQILGEDA